MIINSNVEISIARIYYPVKVLGPGNRVGIWTTGCTRKCEACISPELQYHDPKKMVRVQDVVDMISSIKGVIDGFTISGGEPFFDPFALYVLISKLSKISDDILVFTGYSFEELKKIDGTYVKKTLELCSVLIDGPYIDSLNDGVGLRGSSNQKIHLLRNKEKYIDIDIEQCSRQYQTVVYGEHVLTIGIPHGDNR